MATFLTLLAPGLGYMYVGSLLKGITVNLLFLLLIEAFVIAFAVLKFFPLLPALVVALAWFVFTVFAAIDVRRRISHDEEYILKGYNHWMVYGVVFLLSFATPLLATYHFIDRFLLTFETIDEAGMYPSLRAGDIVMVDRSAFRGRDPVRGEMVAVWPSDEAQSIRRVVGTQGDAIRVEGETLYVNEEPLEKAVLDTETPSWMDRREMLAMIENNRGAQYVISVSPRAFNAVTVPPIELKSRQLYVLADNRSQVPMEKAKARIRDSRNYGPIDREKLEGKPLYIAWSTDPETGELRTERIGLRVQ